MAICEYGLGTLRENVPGIYLLPQAGGCLLVHGQGRSFLRFTSCSLVMKFLLCIQRPTQTVSRCVLDANGVPRSVWQRELLHLKIFSIFYVSSFESLCPSLEPLPLVHFFRCFRVQLRRTDPLSVPHLSLCAMWHPAANLVPVLTLFIRRHAVCLSWRRSVPSSTKAPSTGRRQSGENCQRGFHVVLPLVR